MLTTLLLAALTWMSGVTMPTNAPMGFATCTSLHGGQYEMTGGGDGRTITITSTGTDMADSLMHAIEHYDVVVLDGSQGPFTIGHTIEVIGLKGRSVLGINGAKLQSAFVLSPEIWHMLDTAHVRDYSTEAGAQAYYLSNGSRVREAGEYQVRQHLIDMLNDPDETYRDAGIFVVETCENMIFRNLYLQGPGSVDVGGRDLMYIKKGSHNIWVDHCDFVDGMDGNFDIGLRADLITVSYCTFSYSSRSYMHQNSNLVGNTGNVAIQGIDNLNVTFCCCHWGEGCDQRMPMVRFGTVHVLNCLYTCRGCHRTINPRTESEVLVEGCVWAEGVRHTVSLNDARSYESRDCIAVDAPLPPNLGSVSIPYTYTALPASDLTQHLGINKNR